MTNAIVPLHPSMGSVLDRLGCSRFTVPADRLRAALMRDGRPAHYELFPVLAALERAEEAQAPECPLFYDRSLRRLNAAQSTFAWAVLGLIDDGCGAIWCDPCGVDVAASHLTKTCSSGPVCRNEIYWYDYRPETWRYHCARGHEAFHAITSTFVAWVPEALDEVG